MKTFLFVASFAAITDAQSNALSLVEIVEALEFPQLPVVLPRLSLTWVSLKETSDSEMNDCLVEILNNGEKSEFPVRVDYKGQSRHRAIVQMHGVTLFAPGVLLIQITTRVKNRRKVLAELQLPVNLNGSIQMSNSEDPVEAKKSSLQVATKAKSK
jgi:hypothetical protein